MKVHKQIREVFHLRCDGRAAVTYAVDDDLAAILPVLALPAMNSTARAAFRELLAYEAPRANGPLGDVLQFIEARGYTVHPGDWIPQFGWTYGGNHPIIYQPLVDYLSEHGFTRFHQGNTITVANCRRFSANQRSLAFRRHLYSGDPAAEVTSREILAALPPGERAKMLREIDTHGSYGACRTWQRRLLEDLLGDEAAVVRKVAQEQLDRCAHWLDETQAAKRIASHLVVTDTTVTWREPPDYLGGFLLDEFRFASFSALAGALDLTPHQLAERAEITALGSNFKLLASLSGMDEVRIILAKRALDEGLGGESIPLGWFKGADPALWRRGLEALKASAYVNSVQEFLGDKTGTMPANEMLAWRDFRFMQMSVIRELETGELPINKSYDPLRYLAKIVDKEAAQIILDEAIALGMSTDNPRLTMVKLNLAL